ncbi:tetratricopeptide repeat protein [Actinoplanes palleronii]|nr:tetratricopeptide repeat protein [Actinoplanes palleronii]
MDAGALWTIVGSVAGVGALIIGSAQLQQGKKSLQRKASTADAAPHEGGSGYVLGDTVAVPLGRLPREVVGRETTLRLLARAFRQGDRVIVLAGVGGIGKSTVAAEFCRTMTGRSWPRRPSPSVWWIDGSDRARLVGGLVSVIRAVGGTEADCVAVRDGYPDAPDRLWRLLRRSSQRWVITIDNVDDPSVLNWVAADAPGQSANVSTGTGWVRSSPRGLLIITSRNADATSWSSKSDIVNVDTLSRSDSASILLRLAPQAGVREDAEVLADTLGGLPLVLRVAGAYLAYPLARWATFDEYRLAYRHQTVEVLAATNTTSIGERDDLMTTWELSLDDLSKRGVPEARALLRLISCYAANATIPLDLLDSEALHPLLGAAAGTDVRLRVEQALRGLLRYGLISSGPTPPPSIVGHPAITDSNRSHLRRGSEPSPHLVCAVASSLVVERIRALSFSAPRDWPAFAMLVPHLQALLKVTPEFLGEDDLGALCDMASKAVLAYDWSGGLAAAEQLTRMALHAGRSLPATSPPKLRLLQQEALQRGRRGHWGEALPVFKQLAGVSARANGDDHPVTLAIRHDLARAYAHEGQWTAAENQAREVFEARARSLGGVHVETLASEHHLARALSAQHKWDACNPLFEEIIRKERSLVGDRDILTLATRDAQARSFAEQGRWFEASQAYQAILDIRSGFMGREHPTTLANHHSLGVALAHQGRMNEAREALERVYEARLRVLGRDHPETHQTADALREIDRARGE